MILPSICFALLSWPSTNGLIRREIQLQRVEQIGGENLLDSTGLRVRKYNRTTATLNGTLHFLEDIDQTYDVRNLFRKVFDLTNGVMYSRLA